MIQGGLALSWGVAALGLMKGARGLGAVLTLHRVQPRPASRFAPNAHLEVTPARLEASLLQLKRDGARFVSLDTLREHLLGDGDPSESPLIAITLDDGYRDNLDHAAPIFARHNIPFTVFVVEGFVQRRHGLWWETLAELLQQADRINDPLVNDAKLELKTIASRQAAFDRWAWTIRNTDEKAAIARLDAAAMAAGLDPLALTERLILDEPGLRQLLDVPGAALGAHTVSHRALKALDAAEAEQEIFASKAFVAGIAGHAPTSFAFPYGDDEAWSPRDCALVRRAGMIGVTTRPAVVTANADEAALPRISLNGHYQAPWQVSALISGIPFTLRRR